MKWFYPFVAVLIVLASAAHAQEFSERNVPEIVNASQNNEIRFNRDYRGRHITASGSFSGVQEVMFSHGQYIISVSTNFGDIDCTTAEKRILDAAVDWNDGQSVTVSGIIATTLLGDIQLQQGCSVVMR
jgi:tRNA_anti-like